MLIHFVQKLGGVFTVMLAFGISGGVTEIREKTRENRKKKKGLLEKPEQVLKFVSSLWIDI